MNLLRLSLRTLRREWRLPELRTLAGSLVLAVAALGVVATLSTRVERGVLASAAELIGGDIGVSSPQRLPDDFATRATRDDLKVNRSASFPSVAFAHGRSQLLDVLATDTAYPLRGTLELRDPHGHTQTGHGPAAGNVYLDHRALVALQLQVGDMLQLGGRELHIAAELVHQPDGGQLIALAPRAVMSLADAEQAGLLGIGSRARHRLLLAGAPAAVHDWRDWAQSTTLPQGAQLITPEQTRQRMRSAFECTVMPTYAMTECMPISAPPHDYNLERPGSSGRQLGPQLEIHTAEGAELPRGQVGHIALKGPPVMQGYEGGDGSEFINGWFHTGDNGYIDDEGNLYVVARTKEAINRGGETIIPAEVDAALLTHPAIKSICCFATPHATLQETVGCLVVPAFGY